MSVEEIIQWVPPQLYWLLLAASGFIENVFPPWPGDTVTVAGGALAGTGVISLWSLCISVFVGSMAGALFMYFLGTNVLDFFRRRIKLKSIQELTDPEHLKKSHDWFEKYGIWAVVFSRFSAGIRFFVSIVAGMVKMNIVVFTLAFSAATVLWNAILIYVGYVLGNNWQQAKEFLRVYNIIVMVIIGLIVLIFVYYYRRKKAESRNDAEQK